MKICVQCGQIASELYTDGISGYVCNSCNAEYVRRPKWVPHKWIMILEFAGYAEERMTAEVQGKPAMWFNKSVFRAYHAGIASADKNGNYEWVYGATEHCEDCKRAENGRNRRN